MKKLNELLRLRAKRTCVGLRTCIKYFSQCVNDGIFKEVRDVEENVDLKIVKMCSVSGVPIFIDETVAETLLPIYAE